MASTAVEIVEERPAPSVAEKTRVAWLFPSLARAYYWQPVFSKFVARCPRTAVFTSIWTGFAAGYEDSFAVHTLPGLRFVNIRKPVGDSRRGFIWIPFSIVRELAEFNPEVVFSSGFSAWTLFALLFKLLRRSRVIIYWEGCSAQSMTASRLKIVFRRWMARFANAAVCNGTEGASYLQNVIGMPAMKVLCHPCQVPDLSLLGSDVGELRLPDLKRPVFLYVGSITPRKGWHYLIEASRLLIDRGIRDFSVVFVGAGEEDDKLRTEIRQHKLGDIVHQIGPVEYHNLGAYYQAADVFVTPSRADTWGVAVLEAMAFGKPVLCSRYVGTREMVSDGENGFVFDPFDPSQLADCMSKFIQDPILAERFGARAHARIAPYTPSRAADVLAKLALEIR